MLKKVFVTLCFLSLLFSPITSYSTQASKAAEKLTPSEDSFASDQLIIKLQPEAKVQNNTLSTHVSSLDQALASVNAIALVPLAGLPETYILKMQSDANILDAVETLNREPAVDYAEPDYLAHFASVPDDPRYSEQWGLSKIAVEGAWDQSSGSPNVVIAVIDSGIDLTHEDLSPNLWVNPGEVPGNSLDDDNNGFIDDIHGWNFVDTNNNVQDFIGHGSLVAGIAAARSNNTLGIAGVCGNCRIMPIKVSQVSGIANYSDIAAGVAYATQKGADVINISLGGYSNSNTLRNAIQAAVDQNITVVAGAGNDNSSNLFYPAAYDSVIGVSGTDQDDHKTASSNFGSWVDVSAPGVDILSTTLGDYSLASGTSFSAPFVSGNVGLLLSLHSDWTPAMIRSQLMHTADEIDGLNPGYEGMLGAGRLNATQAMQNPEPILQYQSYSGNGIPNLRPDFGSTVNLNVVLYNDWADALGVSGTLSSTDSYVTIPTPTAIYGDILAGETKANEIAFTFDIAAGAGYNHSMPFELILSANDGAYTTTLNFSITTRSSEETVSGTIAENRTWTNDKTYVVTNNVGLAPGFTLTIEAGTTIKFNGNYSLNLGGTLIAQGTSEQPISFEPYSTGITWNRIYFDNSSLDAQTTAEGEYLSGNVLQYVTLSGASGGIACSSATPYIDHVTTDNGGVTCSLGDSDLWLMNSSFIGTILVTQGGTNPEHLLRVNVNQGDSTLPASIVSECDFFGELTIQGNGWISNSTVYSLSVSNAGVIQWVSSYGNIYTGSGSFVANSSVLGGGIYSENDSSISQNNIENPNGIGVSTANNGTITYNRIINSRQGIVTNSGLVSNNIISKVTDNGLRPGTSSVQNNTFVGISGFAVYLDNIPTNFENNNFDFNTGTYDVYVTVPFTTIQDLPAQNNWWGTTEINQINERIWDYYDDYNLARLFTAPILEQPSQSAPSYVRNVELDPASPVGIETVNFTVEFSRTMDNNVNPILSFNSTINDSWASKAPMPIPRYDFGAVKDLNGKIYIIGGNDGTTGGLSSVFEYDPILESWTQKASLNRSRWSFGTAVANNNKIYVVGGYGYAPNFGCMSSIEEYDPSTNTWTEKAPMSVGRCYFGIAASTNGKILAFGGEDSVGNTHNSVEEYDPETNTWSQKNPMPETRRGFGIVSSRNGIIYLIGGEKIMGEGENDSVYAYNPLTDIWTKKTPMITGRSHLGVVESQNGKIYAIGGIGGNEMVEEYDPILDVWSSKKSLPIGRIMMGIVEGSNHKIYVMGGFAAYTNVDEYSPPVNKEIVSENPLWINDFQYSVDYNFSALNSRGDYFLTVENAKDTEGILIAPDNRTRFTVDYAGEISDTTPPEQPHVLAWGNGSLSQLSAQAYAKDPDSLIVGYRYAIGSSPGSVDVVNWTNISQNQITHTGLSLLPDQPYYVSFQARNEGGLWSPVGVSNPVVNGAELERLYLPLITR